MRTAALVICLLAASQAARPAGGSENQFSFRLRDGWCEVEWISGSSFRFARSWRRQREQRAPIKAEPVAVTQQETKDGWRFQTEHLVVEVAKNGPKLRVREPAGKELSELVGLRREGGAVVLEFRADKSEEYYGLGPRTAAALDLRGQLVRAGKPFLMSSAGYAEYYRGGGEYVFDLARSRAEVRQVRIQGSDRVEYCFHYGPGAKDILEEHVALGAPGAQLDSADFAILEATRVPKDVLRLAGPPEASWGSLLDSVRAMMHASISGTLVAAFDLGPYLRAEGALAERAAQLGSAAPIVWVSGPGVAGRNAAAYQRAEKTRRQLTPFLVAYAQEARERGFPLVRPMGMQYASDGEAWKRTDQFMLGDELLVAPVCTPENRRSVYLPRGIWTHWRSNRVYQGRRTVEIEAGPEELPVFGRNGSIVPLGPAGPGEPMVLHYFPKLAAEFFVLEEDLGDYTLLHAAPAVEVVRLEIESLKERDYEWVVHHTGACRRVVQVDGPEYERAAERGALKPGAWFYDRGADNLHVRARAKAKGDLIINLWLEAVWN